jgi:hypothetical protein
VRAKKAEVKSSKRIKDMVSRDKTVDTTFVVVGGGEFHSFPFPSSSSSYLLNLAASVYCMNGICIQNFTYKS